MKVILFGATGMVGQGVLRECLRDDGVEVLLAVGRSSTGRSHSKLRELVCKDLFDFQTSSEDLRGYDACFFCLGVSSVGMSEADYTRLTYDLTLGWAQVLARANPGMTFVYVSGTGTGGKAMWAQVKGRTEHALLALFPNAYMFRLAILQPMHGEVSKTLWTRIGYATADTGGWAGISHQHRGTGTCHDPSGTAGSTTAGVGESRHDCAWGN
jgi:uncharacterized protein YbjT (DUF2867 family)